MTIQTSDSHIEQRLVHDAVDCDQSGTRGACFDKVTMIELCLVRICTHVERFLKANNVIFRIKLRNLASCSKMTGDHDTGFSCRGPVVGRNFVDVFTVQAR